MDWPELKVVVPVSRNTSKCFAVLRKLYKLPASAYWLHNTKLTSQNVMSSNPVGGSDYFQALFGAVHLYFIYILKIVRYAKLQMKTHLKYLCCSNFHKLWQGFLYIWFCLERH